MNIQMHCLQFPLTQALRSHIKDRMVWAMQRFENQITYARARLVDMNGASRKGVDKRCELTLQFKGNGMIVSTGIDCDAYAAVSMAAKRMRKALAKKKPQ